MLPLLLSFLGVNMWCPSWECCAQARMGAGQVDLGNVALEIILAGVGVQEGQKSLDLGPHDNPIARAPYIYIHVHIYIYT